MFTNRIKVLVIVTGVLALCTAETLGSKRGNKFFAVFINASRASIQIEVISQDEKDEAVLPLRPGAIAGAMFAKGHVELRTSSKDMVSGRLLFSCSLPSPESAPEFYERTTGTFYFRVVEGKVVLVKPENLTLKERKRIAELTKAGW
jgi:hypothetical protein